MKNNKQKLSPLKLEENKARSQLAYITNKVKGEWSFGKLKTFKDLLNSYGFDTKPYFPNELNEPLTFQIVKDWLDDRRIELSTYFWLKNNSPIITYDTEQLHPTLLKTIQPTEETDTKYSPNEEKNAEEFARIFEQPEYQVKKNKAFLFWFQKKSIVQIIDGINK